MMLQSMSAAWVGAALLVGCASQTAATVTPSPSAMPSAVPSASATPNFSPVPPTEWKFGAVTAKSNPIESQFIYQQGANPSAMTYGSAQSFYLTVDGQTYQLRYDQTEAYNGIHVGDTVNLHPTEWVSCLQGGSCHVMFSATKGSRPVPPLVVN